MDQELSREQEVRYSHLTPREFRKRLTEAPIAYLPLGTLEWHGEHLPLGADGLQSAGFFEALARRAGGVVLPMLFVGPDLTESREGVDYYGMDVVGFKGKEPVQLDGSAYWISDSLYQSLVEGVLTQLTRAGFKVVMAHGHGPSTHQFTARISEWEKRFGLRLFTAWSGDDDSQPGIQSDHAAANETSLTMHFHPDLVHLDYLDQDPDSWPIAVAGRDPRQFASAEHGKELVEYHVERLAQLLTQAL